MQLDLYISLDEPPNFVIAGDSTRILAPLNFTLNTIPALRVRFYRNYQIVDLGDTPSLTMTLKEANTWNPDTTLAQTFSWTETTSGDDIYYDSYINLATDEMVAYFKQSRETFRECIGCLTIVIGDREQAVPFTAIVTLNPALNGTTPTPPATDAFYQTVIRYYPTITGLLGGAPSDLDSLVTINLSVPREVSFTIPDEIGSESIPHIYELVSGTDATDSPGTIRPVDYSTSNEKVWKSRF